MASLRSSITWSAMEQVGSKAVALLVQIVLARVLVPEDFGVLAILLVIIGICDSIAQAGFAQALIQKSDATALTYTTAFWTCLALAIVLYLALFFAAEEIASFYSYNDMAACLRVLGLSLMINSANSIQRAYLQKRMKFKELFVTSAVAIVGSGAFGILLALLDFGVWALVAQSLCNGVLACVVMAFVADWKPSFGFSMAEAQEMLGFGWKMSATAVMNAMSTGVSDLILGRLCPAADLGVYSQGRRYPVTVIGALSNALANVLFPALANVKEDMNEFMLLAERSLLVGNALVVPMTVFCAVAGEPLVTLLLSEKWLPCVPVFQLACIAYCPLMLQIVNTRAYIALGRSDVYMGVHVVRALVSLVSTMAAAIVTRNIYCVAVVWATWSALCIVTVDIAPAGRVFGYPALQQLRSVLPIYAGSMLAVIPAAFPLLLDIPAFFVLVLQAILFTTIYLLISKPFGFDAVLGGLLAVVKTRAL